MTVRRLRTLLGNDEAIQVSGGLVSLSNRCFWLDTWALEKACEDRSSPADRRANRLLGLYNGTFLAGDIDADWIVSPRERLRGKFLRALMACGEELEATREYELAVRLFQRGSEVDELAEEIYQGMMRCYLATGRHAEALSVFGRLRQILAAQLAVQPSSVSEALARQARSF